MHIRYANQTFDKNIDFELNLNQKLLLKFHVSLQSYDCNKLKNSNTISSIIFKHYI